MSDDYATPSWLKDVFAGWYDPCPLNSPERNGLDHEWDSPAYVNPPYSEPHKWVTKAIQEAAKGKLVVMLLRVDTSTKWFKLLQENGAMFLWINGRLRFNNLKPANFPSMLVILNKTAQEITG